MENSGQIGSDQYDTAYGLICYVVFGGADEKANSDRLKNLQTYIGEWQKGTVPPSRFTRLLFDPGPVEDAYKKWILSLDPKQRGVLRMKMK